MNIEQRNVNETEPLDERICEPLTLEVRQQAAERSISLSKAGPQIRTLAIGNSARAAIKANGRVLFIDTADLIAVQAQGNYVLLLRTSSSHMLRESISVIEEKLSPYGFVRIHRSVLVNASLVQEIRPLPTGGYMLRVRGREFTATRTYKKNLQALAQLWIGTEGFSAAE